MSWSLLLLTCRLCCQAMISELLGLMRSYMLAIWHLSKAPPA